MPALVRATEGDRLGWFPLGPNFVFAPRNVGYRRLSRRNEMGRQPVVTDIAVDPTFDPAQPGAEATIYITEMGSWGNSAWRSDDDGRSWTPIGDALHQRFGGSVEPTCVTVSPGNPNTIYIGTSRGILVSSNRGDPGSWSVATSPYAEFRKIVVDARTAANPATTVLYAATSGGVLRSADGGMTWSATPVVPGDAYGLAASFDPVTTNAQVYATIWGAGSPNLGLWYATNPSAAANWSNLTDLGIGLPARTGGTFDTVLVDLCAANPLRAYAWFFLGDTAVGLYTTGAPQANWVPVAGAAPSGWLREDTLAFAAAPNSPGNGVTDILVLGSVNIQRSTDAGRTWKEDAVWLHVDHRAIAFAPTRPAADTIPVTYVGCDGGVGKSTRFADPGVAIEVAGSLDLNETANRPRDSHVWQNCNRGRRSVNINGILAQGGSASPAGYPALVYVASWDNGIKGGAGSTWRGISDGDATAIAAAAGPNGVVLWSSLDLGIVGRRWVDVGGLTSSWGSATKFNGSNFSTHTPPVVDLNGSCLVGATTQGGGVILRIPQQGDASQISQDFTAVGGVACVAIDPGNADVLYCLTGSQPARLWSTTSASTATAATVWTEIVAGKPTGQAPSLGGLAVSRSGVAYVGMDYAAGQPPLYAVVGGAWVAQASTNAPPFGYIRKLVADPLQANVLYAISGTDSVYRLTLSGELWSWEKFASDGLPGQFLIDLDAVLVTGAAGSQKVVLRVATPTRGLFEADADPTRTDLAIQLYVRRHFLDTGWVDAVADGVADPYRPGKLVTHAQCADMKVEFPQYDPSFRRRRIFYQTDAEWDGTRPLDPVLFEEISEDPTGVQLITGQVLRIHVQAHNRSRTSADNVSVWTLYTNAAAGLLALDQTATGLSFWTQFTPTGAIVPALPPLFSSWKAVGPPIVLSGVDAAHPQVASWNWTVPPRRSHDRCRSYSFVTFLHSAADPIGETTRVDVDEIAATNRRVGLKNITVCSPINPRHKHHYRRPHRPWGSKFARRTYVEFHNARTETADIDLLVDLRTLPRELGVWFQLTKHETERPLAHSMVGAREVGRAAPSIVDRLRAVFGALLGLSPPRPNRRVVPGLPASAFAPAVYEAENGKVVEVRGVRLRPGGRGALLLSVLNTAPLEPGATFRFEVLQRRRGPGPEPMLVGSATVIMTVAGEGPRVVEPDRPLEDEGPPPDREDDQRERLLQSPPGVRRARSRGPRYQ